MNKIIEKVVEPNKVTVGSTFLLKIKAIRYATFNEVKAKKNFNEIKLYTFNQLKGE